MTMLFINIIIDYLLNVIWFNSVGSCAVERYKIDIVNAK